jgi:hypothetical protein
MYSGSLDTGVVALGGGGGVSLVADDVRVMAILLSCMGGGRNNGGSWADPSASCEIWRFGSFSSCVCISFAGSREASRWLPDLGWWKGATIGAVGSGRPSQSSG